MKDRSADGVRRTTRDAEGEQAGTTGEAEGKHRHD
jgi:hypothetical protein